MVCGGDRNIYLRGKVRGAKCGGMCTIALHSGGYDGIIAEPE